MRPASAPSSSWRIEYCPFAVSAVLTFNCLNRPERGVVKPPSGPDPGAGGGLAIGIAGPAPGLAVAEAGGAQLMYRPGTGGCAAAWAARPTTPMTAAIPMS